jgi:DnaJ like chaperone protein
MNTGIPGQQNGPRTTQGDFVASLLILSAAVMKADGKVMKSELEYVKGFLAQQFGKQRSAQHALLLKEILQKEIPLQSVCHQVRQFMPEAARLQLIHYLFGISKADGHVHEKEVKVIEEIAYHMGINPADMNSIKAMYFRNVESDYLILEISAAASDEEVKKAYRRMAVKYHPDKVVGLGEDVERAAHEKFQKLQDAYDNIKKQRGIL